MSVTVQSTVPKTAIAAVMPLFAATLFGSAGLMFLVEPMVAKMVLPRLGGSPAVWSTCLLFFQGALLLGYSYAHIITRFLPRRAQIVLHVLIVLPLAALSLPLSLGDASPAIGVWPAPWLLLHLAESVGPAAFALSATAPLLQNWFAGLDHDRAADPYFLYAASNAGSLLALIAYPLIVEPGFSLDRQAVLWSWGFLALVAGIALSAAASARRPALSLPHLVAEAPQGALIQAGRTRERIVWSMLAFVPSSLLLGVTTHITADIASAPLFWVLPLALYLITFIIAFSHRPLLPHAAMCRIMPLMLIPVAITMVPSLFVSLPVVLALHLGCLFVVAMVCHGELARRRPAASRLTEFYFFLSLGGVLGGAFNALLAPALFPGVWEYPIALVVACAVKPRTPEESGRGRLADIVLPLALFALVLGSRRFFGMPEEGKHLPLMTALLGFLLPGLALLHFSPRRWRFAAGVAVCLLAGLIYGAGGTQLTARSFFGVYRVKTVEDQGRSYRLLVHGTSVHGVRSLTAGEETLPLGYYSHEGPFGQFLLSPTRTAMRHVGVIGLGVGSLACYAKPGQDWTFFEIDPLVQKLAQDPDLFGFLGRCGNPRVVIGDARLTIAAAADAKYDVLVLDAFSSDSIPMHLLTREALALYLRKLAPDGRLLFHISSRFLDLRQVISALTADAGLCARILAYNMPQGASYWRHSSTTVVAASRHCIDLSGLSASSGWAPLPQAAQDSLWTDQRSDLLQVIRFTGR